MDQIRAAQGGANLHRVTEEERELDRSAKAEATQQRALSGEEGAGGGGLLGAISAALNARRGAIVNSDSDSSSDSDSDDAPGDWSASDDDSD